MSPSRNASRWRRTALIVGPYLAVILIGYLGFWRLGDQQHRLGDTIEEQARSRRDARLVACQKDNDDADKQTRLWTGLLLIAPRPVDPSKVEAFVAIVGDSPTNRYRIAVILGASAQDPTQVAALGDLLADTFPLRDCTPAGIDAYYTTTTISPGG